MRKKMKNQSGFTLIEMLIVIVVLGILAMVIIPQISVSTEDARISTLQTNLSGIRSAIETYYAQHGNTYPGQKDKTSGAYVASDAAARDSFIAQLTQYSDRSGKTANTKDNTFKYGPYIRASGSGTGLPNNPFTETNTLATDYNQGNITVRTHTGTTAWMFYPKTGVFIANNNTQHAVY